MKIERIIEGFVFFPTIIIDWMETSENRLYDLSLNWLFWRIIIINNVSKYLDKID